MDKTRCMIPDSNMNPIPVLVIGNGAEVADTVYVPECEVLRVCAATECRLWNYLNGDVKRGTGLLMPEGAVEYFRVAAGSVVEVEGTANITEEL